MWTKFLVVAAVTLGLVVLLSAVYLYRGNTSAVPPAHANAPMSAPSSDQSHRNEYVLEIIGVGVTLDRYRQGGLWDVLAKGKPYESIRDLDPKHYPWTGSDKVNQSGSREGFSRENAMLDTPRYWGVPVFNAEPRYQGKYEDRPDFPQGGIVSSTGEMHLFVLAGRELSERPDRIVEKIFAFFDQNPTVPYVILGSADSSAIREDTLVSRQILEDGYYVPRMPDASAMLVLARRERVDAIRPFVFRDMEEGQADVDVLNRDGIARRVYLNYLKLEKKVPTPPPTEDEKSSVHIGRQPTSAEWLSDLEIFAKQFTAPETSRLDFKIRDAFSLHKPTLSRQWKPRPWFPVPWNQEQLEQFDRLPTLGYLHRPVFVKLTDADGNPLSHDADRVAALHQGWKSAMDTLPEAQRATGPSRVIVATGGKTSQLVDFHGLLRRVADDGGPKFDPAKPNKFIDTDHRLGNTGAATFFVQTAIGVLGSYREGGISAAFNLRDPSEASIILISPPSDEKRKNQQHPIGGDVFRNATIPMIDPKNYEEPIPQ
jgi:hypothetical protein